MRRAAVIGGVVVLLGSAIVGLSQHEPPSVKRPLVGFNNNSVAGGLVTPAKAAELIASINADVDRVQVNWTTLEPRPGEYDFALYDEIYAADLAAGIRPLFIFAYAPTWANGGICDSAVENCHSPPAPDQYGAAAETLGILAERYPELVGIEIWNEPNVPYFWSPHPDPVAYAKLLKVSYEAIKAAQPTMRVVGSSTSNSPGFGPAYVDDEHFLRTIYEQGAGDSMDVIAAHPYPDPGDVTAQSAIASLEDIAAIRDEFGDFETPIWVTETGMSTIGSVPASAQEQADGLLALSERLPEVDGVEMVLFHTLVSRPGPLDSNEPGFGVIRADGTPTLSSCALSDAWGGTLPC